MASIRFAWSSLLVELRRELCPAARWERRARQWIMADGDAQTFLRAAHARLEFARSSARIEVNHVVWLVGFAQGAPCPDRTAQRCVSATGRNG